MSGTTLTPELVQTMTWDDLRPSFDTLADIPLSAATLDAWLAEWSAIAIVVNEATARAAIAAARDVADPAAEATSVRMTGEIAAGIDEQVARLSARLLGLDPDDLGPDLIPMLDAARNQQLTVRPEQAAARQELAMLAMRYDQIVGGMTAEWDGERVPLAQLASLFYDPEREIRERAMRRWLDGYVERRDEFADLFDEQVRLRQEIAQIAGFANYLEFAFREKNRPYGPEQVRAFHEAVEQTVVPALSRRRERRRQALGVDRLNPWDVGFDIAGRPPLRPASSSDELLDGIERIFRRLDPDFGDQFALMRREGLLDIEARADKAPGGFCTTLDLTRRPFILWSLLDTHDDVTTMLHEGGHAMHGFAVYASQPLIFLRYPGAEMMELAAMSMDLLGSRYLERDAGGFYSTEDAGRARIDQLESILSLLTWIAQVDAFQTWVYTSGQGHDRDARDAEWVALAGRFDPAVSWETYPEGLVARWYQQNLIFVAPLYMVEYGIAQFGALRIWRNSLDDEAGAIAALRTAMRLGNTRRLPDLFAAAGIPFTFDLATATELVAFVGARLAELEAPDA